MKKHFAILLVLLAGCDSDADPGGASGAGAAPPDGGGGGSVASSSSSTGQGGGGGDPGLPAEIEQCLFINACQADGAEPIGMQACVGHVYERQWRWASYGEYRLEMEAMECRFAATTCEGVRACDATPQDFDADCAAMPGETLCVGDTWVICDFDGAATAAFDCGAAGQSCNKDIWAGCGTEACTFGTTPNSCDPDNPDVLVLCSPSGFLDRVDCTKENNFVLVHGKEGDIPNTIAGDTCGDDPMMGMKGCVGQGEPCDFFSQECQGSELVTCAGGFLAHRDCSAIDPEGQSCGFLTEGPFAGGAACGVVESSCDASAPETCESGVVSFCAQGKAQTIACADEGYAGCAEATVGGSQVAYCTM